MGLGFSEHQMEEEVKGRIGSLNGPQQVKGQGQGTSIRGLKSLHSSPF